VKDDVIAAAKAALLTAFGADARELGQPVTAAEIIACIQAVQGVVAVDLDALMVLGEEGAGIPAGLPAYGARWNATTRSMMPAELLRISPDALDITEMTP
jgi:hypothetical protein